MQEFPIIKQRAVGTEKVQTVSARDLHKFLGVKKDFSDWVKAQLKRGRFVEGKDFASLPFLGEGEGSPPRIEYFLTIDTAKHIAMMSGTEKGSEVRDHFIACEKKAIETTIESLLKGQQSYLPYQRQIATLEANLARSKAKANALDLLAAEEGSVCIADAAKILGVPQTDMFDLLSRLRWIFKRSAHGKWLPYADKERRGFLVVCIDTAYDEEAEKKEYPQTRVTLKGLARLAVIFAAYYRRQAEAEQKQLAAEEPNL
jgi:anti-repressor protein